MFAMTWLIFTLIYDVKKQIVFTFTMTLKISLYSFLKFSDSQKIKKINLEILFFDILNHFSSKPCFIQSSASIRAINYHISLHKLGRWLVFGIPNYWPA